MTNNYTIFAFLYYLNHINKIYGVYSCAKIWFWLATHFLEYNPIISTSKRLKSIQ